MKTGSAAMRVPHRTAGIAYVSIGLGWRAQNRPTVGGWGQPRCRRRVTGTCCSPTGPTCSPQGPGWRREWTGSTNGRDGPKNGSWVHSPTAEGEFLVKDADRPNGDAMHHVEVIVSRQELLLAHTVCQVAQSRLRQRSPAAAHDFQAAVWCSAC